VEKTIKPNATWNRSCHTCKNCGSVGVAQAELTFVCRAHPPKVESIVLPKAQGQLEVKFMTIWPQVNKTDWCNEYQAETGATN
jgi:hypothetical protein